MFKNISKESPVIAWWSGGADSAMAVWFCILWFGIDCVRIIFIGTNNEDDDTYRFKKDCEKWYGKQIETISSKKYVNIEDVWEDNLSLNTATGAICSTVLKREVRINFQNRNAFSHQAFGFDIDEVGRARAMQDNYPDSRPIFPLVYKMIKKGESLKLLKRCMIDPPNSYKMGYNNNNCLKTGCVQGGIGYWQKFKVDFPQKFSNMVERERKYSKMKGEPVTICKDQSKGGGLIFLEHNPDFPDFKDISMIKGQRVKSLMECNGFCYTEPK